MIDDFPDQISWFEFCRKIFKASHYKKKEKLWLSQKVSSHKLGHRLKTRFIKSLPRLKSSDRETSLSDKRADVRFQQLF